MLYYLFFKANTHDKLQVMEYEFWENSTGEKPVQEFLNSRPQKEKDKISRQIFLLLEIGHIGLGRQGDFEKIDKIGLWEFRIDYRKFHFRIFCAIEGNNYIFLHVVQKNYPKLKKRDIELAKQRLLQYRKL